MPDVVKCFVHNKQFARSSCHSHHLTPRAAGGLDDSENLVWLCANCHTLAHRCAQLQLHGKAGIASDLANQTYDVPVIRSRFLQVVKEIADSTTVASDFGLGKSRATCIIELDHDIYSKLKNLAYERKEKGRKVGVARYIEVILLDHLRKKGLIS